MRFTFPFVWKIALLLLALLLPELSPRLQGDEEIVPVHIKPAIPTDTGLLREPPLDLTKFTRQDFDALSSSVGVDKIHKKWTDAVPPLPPHARSGALGLTEEEVKTYMRQVRDLFDQGLAVPVSDVGLISTQEDIIRRPMLNHIAAFANDTVRVYLLVQKTSTDKNWGYFSIVQDLTVDPPLDYFAEIKGAKVKFEGTGCYKCHSSGPLAIHPARADLVNDEALTAAINHHIANQPRSRFFFPPGDRQPDYGKPLEMKTCTKCHDEDGDRAPLYRVHSHPIRVLVDFGHMPPKHRLTAEEITELKAWLEQKP